MYYCQMITFCHTLMVLSLNRLRYVMKIRFYGLVHVVGTTEAKKVSFQVINAGHRDVKIEGGPRRRLITQHTVR